MKKLPMKWQKLMENKISNYGTFVEAKGISTEYAQEKILGMSKHEITENKRMYKEEAIRDALFEHELDDIKKNGLEETPKNIDGVGINSADNEDIPEEETAENNAPEEEVGEIENPDIGSLGSLE